MVAATAPAASLLASPPREGPSPATATATPEEHPSRRDSPWPWYEDDAAHYTFNHSIHYLMQFSLSEEDGGFP